MKGKSPKKIIGKYLFVLGLCYALSLSAMGQVVSVTLKDTEGHLKIKKTPVTSLVLYGTEPNIRDLIFKNQAVQGKFCNGLMSGMSQDEIVRDLIA